MIYFLNIQHNGLWLQTDNLTDARDQIGDEFFHGPDAKFLDWANTQNRRSTNKTNSLAETFVPFL